MSSYINFYIFNLNTKTFTPLNFFSRSHIIYEVFDDIGARGYIPPLEKGKTLLNATRYAIPLDDDILYSAKNSTKEKLAFYQESLAKDKRLREEIGSWNNALSEKMEQIYKLDVSISGWEEDIKNFESALSYINFLFLIKEQSLSNTVIYVGIDSVLPDLREDIHEND